MVISLILICSIKAEGIRHRTWSVEVQSIKSAISSVEGKGIEIDLEFYEVVDRQTW